MPNSGKPRSLKLISGSRRLKDAAPSVVLPTVQAVPSAPAWLPNDHARKEWARLAPLLVANRLLTEAATSTLAHVCALHGVIVRSMAAGQQPKAATLGVYRCLLNDFGLTPAAAGRTRAPTAAEPGGTNSFNHRGRRPAERGTT